MRVPSIYSFTLRRSKSGGIQRVPVHEGCGFGGTRQCKFQYSKQPGEWLKHPRLFSIPMISRSSSAASAFGTYSVCPRTSVTLCSTRFGWVPCYSVRVAAPLAVAVEMIRAGGKVVLCAAEPVAGGKAIQGAAESANKDGAKAPTQVHHERDLVCFSRLLRRWCNITLLPICASGSARALVIWVTLCLQVSCDTHALGLSDAGEASDGGRKVLYSTWHALLVSYILLVASFARDRALPWNAASISAQLVRWWSQKTMLRLTTNRRKSRPPSARLFSVGNCCVLVKTARHALFACWWFPYARRRCMGPRVRPAMSSRP